jgi:phosphoesterase RecJ-like protein
MEATPKQEALSLLKAHNRILILPSNPDADSIGSALALNLALKKLGKQTMVVASGSIPERLKFLPGIEEIKTDLGGLQDFVITLDATLVAPKKLSHKYEDGKLEIFITPKNGQFTPDMVSFRAGEPNFDLIVTVDTPDLDLLGETYQTHAKIFTEFPVVNIDHHASNTFFGRVNYVDVAAGATTEVLVGLIEALSQDEPLMDPQIATNLLTGLLEDTGSFQYPNTTPKALTVGAQLVAAGANQAQIVQNLFRTYPLNVLKLWARALDRIRFDESLSLVWSHLSYEDFQATGTESADGLIDKLMSGVPEAKITVLVSEKKPGEVYGSIRTARNINASEMAKLLGGGGHPEAAGFKLSGISIQEALDLVYDKIREYMKNTHQEASPLASQDGLTLQ